MRYLFAIYNILPHWLKEYAAGFYAKKLQSFRKDDSSATRIKQASEREQWSFEEWKKYQQTELEKVLHRAAHHVPYYKQYWQKRGYENEEWKVLENWPILTKQTLRKYNDQFLAEDCNPKKMYTEYTSGTSGTPLTVHWSKETTLEYYAIFERRIKNWHGVNWDMNYVMLGGRMIVPTSKQKPPFWIHNRYMHQLYLSSYHLSPDHVQDYAKAIHAFKPEYIFGYASSMYSLALLAETQHIKLPQIKCAISNAEPLLDHQKQLIEKVFTTKMVNTYGMSELVAGACSNEHDELVLWPEVGYTEVLHPDQDTAVEEGTTGRFIFTSLLNKDMPLIRYEVGDSGSIERCQTGINFYKIKELTGRTDDLIITKDGTRIGRLDPVFKNNFNIKEAQIVQHTFDHFTLNIVPDKLYNDQNGAAMIESLKERIGQCTVNIQLLEHIPRTSSGKFKAVISHVNRNT